MPPPGSIAELTALGRVRLSKNYFMREMLNSEISNFCGVQNFPDDPDLAIQVGRSLCELILEPLRSKFGHVSVRSAFRSRKLNGYGHELFLAGDSAAWCAPNAYNDSRHTWDARDPDGYAGGCATVIIPSYIDYYEKTGDWQSLGWWIRDNLEHHDEVVFFENLCAFNIRWYEGPSQQPISRLLDGAADTSQEQMLTKKGMANFDGDHSPLYAGVMRTIKDA